MAQGYRCGCHYVFSRGRWPTYRYLPAVQIKSHTTVFGASFRSLLTQVYENPQDTAIDEITYTFPLFDGVSVVAFECLIGDRVITGVVKERDGAKATYKAAKARSETAALLEQSYSASDCFATTIANIPPKAKITIKTTYIGELRHDAEVDGIRFTLPTTIAPRYGAARAEILTSTVPSEGMEITVDAVMPAGNFIKNIQSPTHPLALAIGTLSSSPDEDPVPTKGSAQVFQGSTTLDTDFVLQIIAKDAGSPRAMLEHHPTIPYQRALMATLVPKFALKQIRPEIIFIADRSGSMAGGPMNTLKSALQVFLKSLPVGVRFNICSFGSHYEFLFPKSEPYSQDSLSRAMEYVGSFSANFGGTETFNAVKAAVKSRIESIETELLLLTDGNIVEQQQLFDYLNDQITRSKNTVRMFPIGIGNEVSSALIEGVARAGNGFAQMVGNNERLEGKLVRMLKGALTPHIADYAIEVNYASSSQPPTDSSTIDNDDFEIVEKVSDNIIQLSISNDPRTGPSTAPISLFDADAEKMDVDLNPPSADRYAHLPAVAPPKLLQAPYKRPPLFPFSRSNIYLMLSPEASHLDPVSITLRGTAPQGPLELKIPVTHKEEPDLTIHQLAAKKATQELEEGRGWLYAAKTQDDTLVKKAYPARFDEIVEREAVRLGVEYQVGGKWCSFVAVEANNSNREANQEMLQRQRSEDSIPITAPPYTAGTSAPAGFAASTPGSMANMPAPSGTQLGHSTSPWRAGKVARKLGESEAPPNTNLFGSQNTAPSQNVGFGRSHAGGLFGSSSFGADRNRASTRGGLFGSSRSAFGNSSHNPAPNLFGGSSPQTGNPAGGLFNSAPGGFGAMSNVASGQTGSLFGQAQPTPAPQSNLFANISPATAPMKKRKATLERLESAPRDRMPIAEQYAAELQSASCMPLADDDDLDEELDASYKPMARNQLRAIPDPTGAQDTPPWLKAAPKSTSALSDASAVDARPDDLLAAIIAEQSFAGYWPDSAVPCSDAVGIERSAFDQAVASLASAAGGDDRIAMLATALVVLFLRRRMGALEDSWELVVDKAVGWLEEAAGSDEVLRQVWDTAEGLVRSW